ncbi:2-dehydropantoate 2-reductase [Pseudorhodoplanes sp.]|uniref:ketopantoate reductase family protein n=1 Tax=Pseudorhodoplanes sp. TaxID=1934341 RepID=UPI002CE67F1A|nr:2-dehydropantoate 2-reductase [Pseudorhodoplanes sp.]HWV53668.1 2-dehydropantoate 2-reductase [Pseudorhodoplanes sp.]
MRICIFGAGASGGHFAVKLANAGHAVSVVARGPHLAAIRSSGLTLKLKDRVMQASVAATDDPATLGPQDAVIVTVKATGLAAVADNIAPLIGPETVVVFPQNGMSWWYPLALPADKPAPPRVPVFALADRFLPHMTIAQIAGGIIYSANEVEAPGVIKNNSPARNRLDFGPIDGRAPGVFAPLRDAFTSSGLEAPEIDDIRQTVWHKLLITASGSTISLATRNKAAISKTDPALGGVYIRIVRELLAVAAAHGYPLARELDPDKMLQGLLDHKPSLLQDYEQGRPMEIGEMVVSLIDFARAADIAVPTYDALAAITARLAIDKGLYSPA